MSSYNNLSSVSETLAHQIWHTLKDDKHTSDIIQNPHQIRCLPPKEAHTKSPRISVYLYNVTELASMRNQPQPTNPKKPPTLLYLNLRYLITPLTQNAENDPVVLGKIMQHFAEKPVLRGSDFEGSLSESGDELKITLEPLATDEINKLFTMFQIPHKLCVGYSVSPVRIDAYSKPERKPSATTKGDLKLKKQ